MVTLRNLADVLNQTVVFLGCFENMPAETFFEKLEKARCYHGHTKTEMAKKIGVPVRMIFYWKNKEPSPAVRKKCLSYFKILRRK
jgi:DNA-binding XRE family transcriptional regulator